MSGWHRACWSIIQHRCSLWPCCSCVGWPILPQWRLHALGMSSLRSVLESGLGTISRGSGQVRWLALSQAGSRRCWSWCPLCLTNGGLYIALGLVSVLVHCSSIFCGSLDCIQGLCSRVSTRAMQRVACAEHASHQEPTTALSATAARYEWITTVHGQATVSGYVSC